MRVRIESGGDVHNTRVYTEDGQELSYVRSATWHADTNDPPSVELTVLCVPMEVHGEVTRWHGLENVPTEALRAELESRSDGEAHPE